jgi:hypothetical protein
MGSRRLWGSFSTVANNSFTLFSLPIAHLSHSACQPSVGCAELARAPVRRGCELEFAAGEKTQGNGLGRVAR